MKEYTYGVTGPTGKTNMATIDLDAEAAKRAEYNRMVQAAAGFAVVEYTKPQGLDLPPEQILVQRPDSSTFWVYLHDLQEQAKSDPHSAGVLILLREKLQADGLAHIAAYQI